jgi:hypothetical protein
MTVLFEIEITGDKEAAERIAKANADLSGARLFELWERVVEMIAASARENAPHDLGFLLAGITEEVLQEQEDLLGVIYDDEPYAPFQERGTDSYFPNLDALEDWATRHGTTAWVVALAIAGRGIKPLKYFERALVDNVEETFSMIGEGIGTILEAEF